MKRAIIISFIILTICLVAGIYTQTEYPDAVKGINGNEALYHIKFLSSDELRGRDTFTQEQYIAARYIANEFEKYGVKPVTKNGSYYQDINMDYAKVGTSNSLEINGKLLAEEQDFQVAAVGRNKIEGEIVFIGYGITANNYDSYADVDVKNKIVMVFEGKISRKGEKWIFAPLHEVRILNAINHGAKGMLFVRGTSPKDHKMPIPSEFPLERLKLKLSFAEKFDLCKWNDEVFKKWSSFPMIYITMDTGNNLLANTGKTIAEFKEEIDKTGKPHSFALDKTVKVQTDVFHHLRYTMNVIGMIEGADPSLKNEFVIIGAHYDHVGIDADSGEVYNGADDNASGTAALLEIAQAFAECEKKPKRSVSFITFTGEEQGIIGSQYYVDNPIIPLDKTVAMLNMDMIGRNDPDAIEFCYKGPESFLSISQEASNNIGIKINIEKQNLLMSTDHSAFFPKDVPVAFYHDGGGDFAHKTYDTWDKILPDKIEKVARLCFLTAYNIADQE